MQAVAVAVGLPDPGVSVATEVAVEVLVGSGVAVKPPGVCVGAVVLVGKLVEVTVAELTAVLVATPVGTDVLVLVAVVTTVLVAVEVLTAVLVGVAPPGVGVAPKGPVGRGHT